MVKGLCRNVTLFPEAITNPVMAELISGKCPLRVQAVSKRSLFKQFNLAIGFEAQNLVLSFSLSLVGWGARMCRYI